VRPALRELAHPRRALESVRDARQLSRLPLGRDLGADAPSKRVLIVSLTADLEHVRLEALLAKALQVHGGEVSVYVFRANRESVRRFRALGVRDLVFYEDHAPAAGGAAAEAERLVAGCSNVQDYKELEYRGARVGRQALSTVVRTRRDPRIDLTSPEIRAELARAVAVGIEGLHAGERVLDAVEPETLLMIERGYAGLGAISDLAINRGLPVVQFGSAHRDDAFHLKRYMRGNRDLQQRSLDDKTWSQLVAEGWSDEKERELAAELAARESGKWFLAKRLRHARTRRTPDEVRELLGLDPTRKVAALFSHVLWDASMFFGRDLYPDQGAWFRETLRLAAADDSVQWLVKLHPALFLKLEVEGVTTAPAELDIIRDAVGALPPHVKLLLPDADISNEDLFPSLDAGVTIRGTVGIELPQLGVPVLTAGTSDYSGRGFTVDAETIDEYARNLGDIAALAPLEPEQVSLAKLYGYGVFCRRPWIFDSFELEFLPPSDERALPHVIRYRVETVEELRRAPDLHAFADWVLNSDDADFTVPSLTAAPFPPVATAR
jgi:hypothetical protein